MPGFLFWALQLLSGHGIGFRKSPAIQTLFQIQGRILFRHVYIEGRPPDLIIAVIGVLVGSLHHASEMV